MNGVCRSEHNKGESYLGCLASPHQYRTMPRSLSVRPQRLVLSGDERVQNEFIKALGPYFACAKFDDHGPEFLARTFNVWFARWPLKLADFEDADFMQHRRLSIEKVRLYFTRRSKLSIFLLLGYFCPFMVGMFQWSGTAVHLAALLDHL